MYCGKMKDELRSRVHNEGFQNLNRCCSQENTMNAVQTSRYTGLNACSIVLQKLQHLAFFSTRRV